MEGLPDCGSIMDTFGIDDLLDFSNEDIAGAIGDLDDDTMQQQQQLSAESSLTVETVSCNFSATGNNNNKSKASPAATTGAAAVAAAPSTGISSLIEKDFCVPYEDMVELEWLSNFVEDSFSAGNASHSNNILGFSTGEEQKHNGGQQQQQQQQQQQHQLSSTNNSKQQHFHMLSPVSVLESSATSERATGEAEVVLPSKARSKRGRPTAASRVLGSSSSASSSYDEEEEEEEETSDAHESDCALSTESEVMTEEHELEWPPRKPPPPPHPFKKQCLKESGDGGSAAAGRRCSHCLTQRTPQWRAGPLGPKTLCNACGVRFKSGRLLPEYRPAGSPTFMADKHSNSHRKVLEMRKQREEVASTVKRLQEAEGELEEEQVILLS